MPKRRKPPRERIGPNLERITLPASRRRPHEQILPTTAGTGSAVTDRSLTDMSTTSMVGGSMPPKSEIDTSTYSGRVAARLRSLREAKGWTVADLGQRIKPHLPPGTKLAKSTLHSWDNGSRGIDPDYFPAIAKAFRLSVRGFLPAE